jgi:hypothetical protein
MPKYRFRLVRVRGLWRCQVKRRWWFWRTFHELVTIRPLWERPREWVDEDEAERWLRNVAEGYKRSQQRRKVRELRSAAVS